VTTVTQGVGQPGFTARHGLATTQRAQRAAEVAQLIKGDDLRAVRLAVVDQHGAVRAKSLSPDAAIAALEAGLDFPGSIYSLDTGGNVFVPPFAKGGGFGIDEFTGFPDVMLVPDPATYRTLPWADRTGWMLCDAYFGSGRPVPVDGRGLLRRKLTELADAGYDFICGLEIEFYILPDAPRGPSYLSEARLDAMSEILDAITDALTGLGYPPRSVEDGWGPGQVEISFAPLRGMEGADAAAIIRSAIKQVCRRRGLLATFMCQPGRLDFLPSGWHLHQSLAERANGHNAFATAGAPLSATGVHYVAGLLEHAAAALPFAAPTINGYRRYRAQMFAPDRACWAVENRGTLVRVQGAPHDTSSHVELRSGEPAANPYLYLASAVVAGLDGIRRGLEPPAPAGANPYSETAPPLPGSLPAAITALEQDSFYRTELGDCIIDYLLLMKRAEIARYEESLASATATSATTEVTPWETREYLELF
jgi:glutamine synthetase